MSLDDFLFPKRKRFKLHPPKDDLDAAVQLATMLESEGFEVTSRYGNPRKFAENIGRARKKGGAR